MTDADKHAQERSPGQAPPAQHATSVSANARTGAVPAAPTSPGFFARARRIPPRAMVAGFGIASIAVLVSAAVFFRSAEDVDALEESVTGEGAEASASGAASAAVSSIAGQPSASAVAGEPAKSAALPEGDPKGAGASPSIIVPEGDRAGDQELSTARASGSAALEALLKKHPRDLYVLKALVSAYSLQKNHVGAISAASRLLSAEPSFATDSDIEQTLIMAANGPPNASAVALDLISTKLGARGPDLLYELLISPNIGKLPRDRAARLLREPSVQKLASPALLIAIDLKNTQPCARTALYGRAREHGDARSMVFLKPMASKTGCGFLKRSDCFGCLEPRKELFDTIAAIQKRLQSSSPGK